MERINASWYVNGDPEQGLNPRVAFVNDNTEEENLQILAWAMEHVKLVNLNVTEGELTYNKNHFRAQLSKMLSGCYEVASLESSLCGCGTLEEHKKYDKMYYENLSRSMGESPEGARKLYRWTNDQKAPWEPVNYL